MLQSVEVAVSRKLNSATFVPIKYNCANVELVVAICNGVSLSNDMNFNVMSL